MDVSREDLEGLSILKPVGDLTNHSAPAFRKKWQAVFEEGTTNIVLDLSEIGLLSSIGIREIMSVYKDCAAKGGKLVLCDLGDQVYDILETTGLMTVFTVCESREEALASF